MEQRERLAVGIAWALDAEVGDDPVDFWRAQTDEYRDVLLAASGPLSDALEKLRRH